jgi:putative ABC transport system substrate-binding protein
MTRIGVLNPQGVPTSIEDALRHGLRKVGHVEGRNLVIEWRRNAANRDEMHTQATDLAASRVDLIVAIGSPATRAALDATTTPVVFSSGDPVGGGFAASLARPGGMATGVSIQTTDLNRKRLELVHQLEPHARRVAYLFNNANPLMAPDLAEIEAGARALGVTLVPLGATTDAEIDRMLDALRQRPVDAVVVSGDFTLLASKANITRAVREAKLPAVFPYREYHESGALMSYAPDMEEVMYRIATYVDRILRGARPGELPIEQISTYELMIDLRVARFMHLRVPQELIVRANAVVQ